MLSFEVVTRMIWERQQELAQDTLGVRDGPHEIPTWIAMALSDLQDAFCCCGFRHPDEARSLDETLDVLAELMSCLQQHGHKLEKRNATDFRDHSQTN